MIPKTNSKLTEIKKVLKPDVFQEFQLEEKTVISHNVAMYVQSFGRHC